MQCFLGTVDVARLQAWSELRQHSCVSALQHVEPEGQMLGPHWPMKEQRPFANDVVGQQIAAVASYDSPAGQRVPVGVVVSVAVAVSVGVAVAVFVAVPVGLSVGEAVAVSVGVVVAVVVGVLVAEVVGVLVADVVGVLVAEGVGVWMAEVVGVGLRHTPLTQSWSEVQQVFPQLEVPCTHAQRRRPVESDGKHSFEQQFPALTQTVPPARQLVAASLSRERRTLAVGTPTPSARVTPPTMRRKS